MFKTIILPTLIKSIGLGGFGSFGGDGGAGSGGIGRAVVVTAQHVRRQMTINSFMVQKETLAKMPKHGVKGAKCRMLPIIYCWLT